MVLTESQKLLLNQYRDKSYCYHILCDRSSAFFSFIKSICNIPLILISSVLSIINASSFDANEMKLPNIIINALMALILGLISNFKINEKAIAFKTLSNKMMKYTHTLEDDLTNNMDSLTPEDITKFIKQYDELIESNDFNFPSHIKKQVKNMYYGKRTLPAILNCEGNFTVRGDLSVHP